MMSLFQTAFDLVKDSEENYDKILFGCKSIDDIIGGLPSRGITEISGEAGSGKTQLCLNLALEGTFSRKNNKIEGQSIYLTSGEGSFPIKRLLQLSKSYELIHQIPFQRFLDNIILKDCLNQDDTVDVLFKLIPLECQSKKIRLIILDSLAGLVRFEYDNKKESEVLERTNFLFKISSQLKWLSDTFKISIVIVNQVSMKSINEYISENIPALGLAWSHCINTRITLKKSSRYLCSNNDQSSEEWNEINQSNHPAKKTARILKVEFSPCIPLTCCEFVIGETGLQSIT